MAPSPSFVPVIRTGVDVTFNNITVVGITATDTVRLTGATVGAVGLASNAGNSQFDHMRQRLDGRFDWGPGNAARDTNLYRSGVGALTTDGFFAMGTGQSGGSFSVFGGQVILGTAGVGLAIKEGANACAGLATMVAGTVTVPTTKVTATSRIQLTAQTLGTVTAPKALAVTGRTAGTSFVITSADPTDTSTVAWCLIEPA